MSEEKIGKKENLEKLLPIIDTWMSEEGNEWFSEELGRLVDKFYKTSKMHQNAILTNISEQTITDILYNQAYEFYQKIDVSQKVHDELIEDYVQMELYRRRDDFEGFALSVYQQLEAISNYYIRFGNTIDKFKLVYDKGIKTYIDRHSKRKMRAGFNSSSYLLKLKDKTKGYYKVEDYTKLFKLSNSSIWKELNFKSRVRLILYTNSFDCEVNHEDTLEEYSDILEGISICRNLAHRPKKEAFWENQIPIVDAFLKNRQFSYFQFYKFLEKIVNT